METQEPQEVPPIEPAPEIPQETLALVEALRNEPKPGLFAPIAQGTQE